MDFTKFVKIFRIMRVYLIGYMAAGKSRLGKDLAEQTGFDFIDLDDLFEERYRISIIDFFDKYNEEIFRKLEQEILLETKYNDHSIISTGGGTPCFFDNMQFIRDNGTSVYIRVSPSGLSSRLLSIRRKRPLLKDLPPLELEPFIVQQLEEREHFYLLADHIVDGPDVDPKEIIRLIPGLSGSR